MLGVLPFDPNELRALIEPVAVLLPLTPRLLEVFFEVCYGRSASEIAESLGISPKTVETDLKLLFNRLGVSGHRAVRSIGMAMLMELLEERTAPRRGGRTEHPLRK